MPDTIRTLSALQTLLADNTAGDISPQDVRDMLVSTYLLDYSADVSVTGATTATVGKWHICSGTSADYTLTLPAASGNAGQLIGLRMSSALTKLVTIDGNSTELIDGSQTRVMWANETAVLFCDGTGWTKIAGKSIPMVGKIQRTTAMSSAIANTTVTKVTLNTAPITGYGVITDTTDNRLTITRPGVYMATGILTYDALGAATNAQSRIHVNGSSGVIVATTQASSVFWYPASMAEAVYQASVGDYFELFAYQTSGAGANIYPEPVNWLHVIEVPQW